MCIAAAGLRACLGLRIRSSKQLQQVMVAVRCVQLGSVMMRPTARSSMRDVCVLELWSQVHSMFDATSAAAKVGSRGGIGGPGGDALAAAVVAAVPGWRLQPKLAIMAAKAFGELTARYLTFRCMPVLTAPLLQAVVAQGGVAFQHHMEVTSRMLHKARDIPGQEMLAQLTVSMSMAEAAAAMQAPAAITKPRSPYTIPGGVAASSSDSSGSGSGSGVTQSTSGSGSGGSSGTQWLQIADLLSPSLRSDGEGSGKDSSTSIGGGNAAAAARGPGATVTAAASSGSILRSHFAALFVNADEVAALCEGLDPVLAFTAELPHEITGKGSQGQGPIEGFLDACKDLITRIAHAARSSSSTVRRRRRPTANTRGPGLYCEPHFLPPAARTLDDVADALSDVARELNVLGPVARKVANSVCVSLMTAASVGSLDVRPGSASHTAVLDVVYRAGGLVGAADWATCWVAAVQPMGRQSTMPPVQCSITPNNTRPCTPNCCLLQAC
jgi:hypothetical protein